MTEMFASGVSGVTSNGRGGSIPNRGECQLQGGILRGFARGSAVQAGELLVRPDFFD
jgi:hypothetical protein